MQQELRILQLEHLNPQNFIRSYIMYAHLTIQMKFRTTACVLLGPPEES